MSAFAELAAAAETAPQFKWLTPGKVFSRECPLCAGELKIALIGGAPIAHCAGGCGKERIFAALAKKDGDANEPVESPEERRRDIAQPAAAASRGGRAIDIDSGARGEAEADNQRRYARDGRGPVDSVDRALLRVPPHDVEAEQSVLGAILIDNRALAKAQSALRPADFYREAHRIIFDAMVGLAGRGSEIDAITLTDVLRGKGKLEYIGGPGYFAELAGAVPGASAVLDYARIVREKALKRAWIEHSTEIIAFAFNGVSAETLAGEAHRRLEPLFNAPMGGEAVIPWEGFGGAVEANAEYLKRTAVIDKLCYSHAVSMITGGKHAGKSTLARWMAVCVAKGWPFLGREVSQGPVFYIASEDETMAARQELIRLGWTDNDPLHFLSSQAIDDSERFLVKLPAAIRQVGAKLVIMDMLFDFVHIADEMSYAGTREALGKIQEVAMEGGTHVTVLHHAPKNAMIGDAAVAALGSQGLAARVSPIILVRRFGPGVHSISSTSVRDPRGEAIIESRLTRKEDGSVDLGGAWKNYMLAEVYADRVLAYLQDDPGAEASKLDVAEALDIAPAVARGCLAMLHKQGVIARIGDGKRGKPYRYAFVVTDVSGVKKGETEDSESQKSATDESAPDREQGWLSYKD